MSQHYVGGMKVRTALGTFRVRDTCPLLISRMTVLDIDPGELNDADPLLFREMQGLCTLCSRKAECMLDLEQHDASLSWKVYCPNAATLGAVAELVGIEGGVVSGLINLESSDVGASDRRPRHEEHYHEA